MSTNQHGLDVPINTEANAADKIESEERGGRDSEHESDSFIVNDNTVPTDKSETVVIDSVVRKKRKSINISKSTNSSKNAKKRSKKRSSKQRVSLHNNVSASFDRNNSYFLPNTNFTADNAEVSISGVIEEPTNIESIPSYLRDSFIAGTESFKTTLKEIYNHSATLIATISLHLILIASKIITS